MLVTSSGMIDCHVHVFDPARHPYAPDTFYAPAGQELGTPARLAGVLDWHGVEHAVLVGPSSAYGEDNSCLLDALARVRVHIDHFGRADPSAGLDAPGFVELLRWGQRGRAVVKLSGAVKVSKQSYPHSDLLPFVEKLVAEFGPDHCVWASDWPFLRMPERVDYGPLLALVARQVPDENDRRAILWDTPRREYGFP